MRLAKTILPLVIIAIAMPLTLAHAQTDPTHSGRVLRNGVTPTTVGPQYRPAPPNSTFQADMNAQAAIMKDCGVSASQVRVQTQAGGAIRAQVSPTLSEGTKKCVNADIATYIANNAK